MLTPETQLRLPLGGKEPHSPDFFVPHSGVAPALAILRAALATPERFFIYRLLGRAGSGKTHLFEVIRREAAEANVTFAGFDEPLDWTDDNEVRRFIDAYERMKTGGGLMVCACAPPDNPHVASRFSLAHLLEIHFPADGELRPLVAAILERRGLRLPEPQLDYLLERLPASPLSLSDIFAKIDRLSLARGKQPNRAVFREVLEGEFGKRDNE